MMQEYRIFTTDATQGNVTTTSSDNTTTPNAIYSIQHNPQMEKRHPSMSVYRIYSGQSAVDRDRMWMFWQGGDNGRWSIYYCNNDDGPMRSRRGGWDWLGSLQAQQKFDLKLRTPDCLSSVSSPNAVHRTLWANLTISRNGF